MPSRTSLLGVLPYSLDDAFTSLTKLAMTGSYPPQFVSVFSRRCCIVFVPTSVTLFGIVAKAMQPEPRLWRHSRPRRQRSCHRQSYPSHLLQLRRPQNVRLSPFMLSDLLQEFYSVAQCGLSLEVLTLLQLKCRPCSAADEVNGPPALFIAKAPEHHYRVLFDQRFYERNHTNPF
jgi:hypothetical protein